MVFDNIQNLKFYKGIYENLDTAIDYILNNDISKLRDGKNIIDGEKVYVNVINGSLSDGKETDFEYHKKYLDLHVDIDGEEIVKYSTYEYSERDIIEEYREDGDYGLLKVKENCSCKISSQYFTICMLDEPHKPLVSPDGNTKVRKAIFKILVGGN